MNNAIGIDLGGTNIKYALVHKNGNILFESLIPTNAEKGREKVLKNIKNAIQEVLNFAIEQSLEVIGLGIGTPGIIDDGLVLGGAENLPEWENLPLSGILEQRFKMPVLVDNDANLLGLAEVRFGAAKNEQDVVFLTIGTGVGGAMIIDGHLYGGHRNRGAELGHIIVDQNGENCSCGAKGCLEAHASVTALIRDYKSYLPKRALQNDAEINGKYIVEKYHAKELAAVKAMERHFDYLASGIAGFINVFSPQKVIIGGGISESGEFYVDNIRQRVLKIVMKETSIFTVIEQASIGNKAGFMGAAALVFDRVKASEVSI